MAVAVPAIAWFKQSALFLLLAAVLVMGLVMAFWRGARPARSVKGIRLCFDGLAF
jgi:hypothetical protein